MRTILGTLYKELGYGKFCGRKIFIQNKLHVSQIDVFCMFSILLAGSIFHFLTHRYKMFFNSKSRQAYTKFRWQLVRFQQPFIS